VVRVQASRAVWECVEGGKEGGREGGKRDEGKEGEREGKNSPKGAKRVLRNNALN